MDAPGFSADAQWLTPAHALGVLALFALAAVLLFWLIPLLLVILRPLMSRLEAWRAAGVLALSKRNSDGDGRQSRLGAVTLRMLERDAAELLLIAAAGVILLACGGALLWLVDGIAEEQGLVALDHAVFAQLRAWRQGWLDVAMIAVTELGGAGVSVAVGVVVFAWLAWRRAWAAAAYWVIALLGARACVVALKFGLQRHRPASIYSGLESYSFPSGHATSSMVTYGFLAFLICLRQPWRVRVPVLALTAVAVAVIGLSRLYLGMHWLSDVVAGFVLGLAWITLLGLVYVMLHAPARLPAWQLATVAAVTVMVAAGYLAAFRLQDRIEQYRRAGALSVTDPVAVPASPGLPTSRSADAIPAADRSCDGRCPALRSGSPLR
jgi:undecaprenyl-diphosphatase